MLSAVTRCGQDTKPKEYQNPCCELEFDIFMELRAKTYSVLHCIIASCNRNDHHVFAANVKNDDPNRLRFGSLLQKVFYKLSISEVCLSLD